MDEVDGNSRDTSTDGSSGDVSHISPELQLLNSETQPRLHLSWSSPQLPGHINYSPQLRDHNFSCSERTVVDRTYISNDPLVASVGGNQFGKNSQSSVRPSEILYPRYVRKNNTESSLTHSHAVSGEDPTLPKIEMPLLWPSRADVQSEVLLREDERVLYNRDLHSETLPQRRESNDSHSLELRSDLNSLHENDLEQNKFVPVIQSELSLRPDIQPAQQMDLREHLPKPPSTAPRETNTERNARMLEKSACHLSMTGSFIQQCSDTNDFESYGQFYRESNTAPFNCLPLGANHLEVIIQNQDDLLRSRDQEILELKGANHTQSLFIEKMIREKRLLETAVVEQARLLMSHGVQRSNTEPVRQPVLNCGGAFDSQLYETQLATYKEDFENERKEKLLVKASADSYKDQLQTALNELRLAKEKIKRTEDELERYKNPYRAAYQPYLQNFSSRPSSTASSSSTSAASSAQSKTSLYRKPGQLEPDRVNQTSLPTRNHLSHTASNLEEKAGQSESTSLNQLCRTKEARLARPSDLYQINDSDTTKRPSGQDNQITRIEMINSDQPNQLKQMDLTRQEQLRWMNCSEHQILAY